MEEQRAFEEYHKMRAKVEMQRRKDEMSDVSMIRDLKEREYISNMRSKLRSEPEVTVRRETMLGGAIGATSGKSSSSQVRLIHT